MAESGFLKDPRLMQDLQRYKQRDNHTNLYYLAGAWLYLAVVFAAAVACFVWRSESGLHWSWDALTAVVAILLMGAGQHHLGALGHEGAHFSLFRNRLFNEVAADLFCMFPIFSTTDTYRAQHLAHHKYVNDPVRDPDQFQLQASGHQFRFPKEPRDLLTLLLTQLWPISQIRYTLSRMKYGGMKPENAGSTGADAAGPGAGGPAVPSAGRGRLVPSLLGAASHLAMIGLLSSLVVRGNAWLLTAAPVVLSAAVLGLMSVLPARWYPQSRPRCPIPSRWHHVMQAATYHLMLMSVGWLAFFLGARGVAWWLLLWVLPLLTSFSLYMMIRQVLHHSNAGRGWLTNSRNYFVNPLIRFAVFPLGQDMHLVHHMFSSIPHYNLRPLHHAMMRYPEYRDHDGVVVERFVFRRPAPGYPTVVEILGPEHAPRGPDEPFIDYSVDEAGVELETPRA